MNMTRDEAIQSQIQYLYINELRHYKLFSQIYNRLTGQSMAVPTPNIKINNSLVDSIDNCIDKGLEEVTLYRKIQNLVPSACIRNALDKMIIDKQRTIATLNFIYARKSPSRNTISPTNNIVTIKFKDNKKYTKYIDENLKIPILDGIKNKTVQDRINASLEDDIMEFKRQMEEAAEENGSKAEKDGKNFIKYSISNNSTITYNKNNILSMSTLYYEYIGGLNSYIRAPYNFDIETGKPLGLKSVFNPGVPYRELINNEIRKQLILNKEIYPPDAAQNFKGIAEDHPFYLEDGNIVLLFGFNEIAPTISEIPVIKIPFSAFKDTIKPIFLS